MTGILTLRDAVVTGIQAQMPELLTVEKVRGKITEQGLQRLSLRPPAVAVAFLGITELRPIDTAVFKASCAMIAFLVTEGQDRVDEGARLLERLVLTIATNTWGVSHTGLASAIDSQTIYDDRTSTTRENKNDFAENGLFMQGVSWVQDTRIQRVLPVTGAGRPDDRAQAKALGQGIDPTMWPEVVETVIVHPGGVE